MGFLTDEEVDALRVNRMILHVVGKKGADFVKEPEIPVQQEEFFRSRILSAAASGVHSFNEHSQIRPILQEMAAGTVTFEGGGQELSRLFWRDHVKTSTSGAFFVFELRGGEPDTVLFALIKYDYREAVELSQVNGQSVLREIIQAFVKDRRAVQKFCLVRVCNGVAEELVSASDRMEEAPDLTDYFEKYLGVQRSRSTSELSSRLGEALRSALEELREFLPDKDAGLALERAKAGLLGRNIVTNDDVVEAILDAADRPTDESLRAKIERTARRKLKAQNLEEVEFRPTRQVLQAKPRRVVRTAEEVKLEYPDDEIGRSVTRQKTEDGYVFTIRTTKKLVEDATVPYRAPRAPAVPAPDTENRV